MRRFEFIEGKSSKFWQVEQVGSDLHIQWGRIGTAGQSQVKSFADEGKAQAALSKLITEKTAKGYVEVGAAPAAPPAPAAPSRKPPAAAPQPAQHESLQEPAPLAGADEAPPPAETVAPWLANGDPVRIPAELMQLVLPSRRFPQPVETVDAATAWQEISQHLARLDLTGCTPRWRARVETALHRLYQDALDEECASSEAELLRLLMDDHSPLWLLDSPLRSRFVEYLIAHRGLPQALEVLLLSLPWDLQQGCSLEERSDWRRLAWLRSEGDRVLVDLVRVFRSHLAVAPEAEWAICAERIREALPTRLPMVQVVLALLLPEAPELAADVVAHQLKNGNLGAASYLLPNLRDPVLIADIVKAYENTDKDYPKFWRSEALVFTAVHTLGSTALQWLIPLAKEDNGYSGSLACRALACIGTPHAIATLAHRYGQESHFHAALERWPLAAIAALAGLLVGERHSLELRPYFSALVREQIAQVPRLLPWLAPQAREVLRREAAKFDASRPIATQDELPPVLASPPWLKPPAKKSVAALALEPLALPAEEHWQAGEREAILQRVPTPMPGLLDVNQLVDRLEFHPSQRGRAAEAIRQGDALGLRAAWDRSNEQRARWSYVILRGSDVLRLPDTLAVAFWNHALQSTSAQSLGICEDDLIWALYGLRVLPGLMALQQSYPAQAMPYLERFAAVEIAPLMARALARLKSQRNAARRWLLNHPEHSACALIAPALGKRCEARNQAAAALRMLAEQGHEALILEVAARYDEAKVVEAVRSMLAEDPLEQFPSRRSPLPPFWQPHDWTRPLLRDSGKALPPAALDALGQIMTFPVVGEPYAGLAQVRETCTPQSLAEFAWDCFTAWLNQGALSKENWAFAMLGHLGNDDTARRLAPLIRNWPSEGAFARAVAGLDVLANIGSDVSLMLLNGIAQKVKSKGLQDRAREKIQAIAETRGLSAEELEDRLVPSFDLDARGTLELDFGPRCFTVGFDELLKPYVRDANGTRLANLPKPRQSDDAEKSQNASKLFTLLKKDVRTIASEQVRRLEAAMCNRRRWLPEAFRQCLVEHPLLRHLVQRLVWGVYAVEGVEDEQSGQGGRLLQCFRIAEDGSATDASDDPIELPEGPGIRYGLPHPLELTPEQAAAFAELFADYQLMQPFAQLGRDTHQLSENERASGRLERWNGVVIDTGRLFSLGHRGWKNGDPADGAYYHDYSKPLDERRVAMLIFEPGVPVYMPDAEPTQTLRAIHFGRPQGSYYCTIEEEPFATLDPIAASELIRDMEHLCA